MLFFKKASKRNTYVIIFQVVLAVKSLPKIGLFVIQAWFSRFLNLKKGPKVIAFRPAGPKVTERA